MTDFFAEFNGYSSAIFVVGDAFGGDGGLGLCLGRLDIRFVNLEFMRVQDNLVFESVQFL